MKNLRCRYRTGRSKKIIEITSGKDKAKYEYETTVVTESGEYKEKEWEQLVVKQAKELLETDILDKLINYSLKDYAWINTDEEAYKYGLELYASRIWENKNWVGYEVFNKLLSKEEVMEQMSLI